MPVEIACTTPAVEQKHEDCWLIDCVACTCQQFALACMVDHCIITTGSFGMWWLKQTSRSDSFESVLVLILDDEFLLL